MKRYNEVYAGLADLWRNKTDIQKHQLVKGMFIYLASDNREQEKEFAILDFMDRWVYGTNTSTDTSSLKCERGFAQYKRY